MIEIDGSRGEGGGQVLRTALSLSVLSGKPFRIHGIRAGRKVSGLRPQHLSCIRAAGAVSRANVAGDVVGSGEIVFEPSGLFPGEHKVDVGTAGSTSLVFQAVFLPLARAGGRSSLTVTGGTHVRWSPPFHYLRDVFLATVDGASVRLVRAGYYPAGGGRLHAEFTGSFEPVPFVLEGRGALLGVRGVSYHSKLDRAIAERTRRAALKLLRKEGLDAEVELAELPARAPGCGLHLVADFERTRAGFSSLGERGKKAERVAKEAANDALGFIRSDGAADPYLADQLLLPAACARGESRYSTTRVTRHLTTNARVVGSFLDVSIEIRGEEGEPGQVVVRT